MSNKIEATYKSQDTEEWIDRLFYRRAGYLCARLGRKAGVHPNVITIISIILGVAAAYLFHYHSLSLNMTGMLLLVAANILDSADGQLARMTGKKTLWGRILDGFAGNLWFIAIYAAFSVRLTHEPLPFLHGHTWGVWIWILMFLSGFAAHKKQAALADYYRNIYLLFKGGKSELDRSSDLEADLAATPRNRRVWKIWLFFYTNYTKDQERWTPCFQRLMAHMENSCGNSIPATVSEEFCRDTFHLLKWTNVLTFNTRAFMLFLTLLADVPWVYGVVELTLYAAICEYMRRSHETASLQTLKKLENETVVA